MSYTQHGILFSALSAHITGTVNFLSFSRTLINLILLDPRAMTRSASDRDTLLHCYTMRENKLRHNNIHTRQCEWPEKVDYETCSLMPQNSDRVIITKLFFVIHIYYLHRRCQVNNQKALYPNY